MDMSLSTLMDLSLEQQQQQQQQQRQQHDQQDGTGKSLTNHESIDGAALFQDNGTNKRIKTNPANRDKSCFFFADLNDSNEPSHKDMARRNKFAERRRKRTEKHAMSHAEEILSQVLQIEAEEQAPEDQQVEFVAAINDRSSANSSSTRRSAERHHLTVALDILSELDDDDADDE